ncbi:pseudouridine synthase [Cokeromyces recurvatus]|uniref:pseudouridine synthase n=1 Tax=Cokeromyces recurvatus TaxID=90255 RepID=UPI00221ED811|nr:pseudouridine synthase [Cokeromyces recurvatus]KAI7897886.1 pseudouridine synthase [Cokeromyces recurvatus]
MTFIPAKFITLLQRQHVRTFNTSKACTDHIIKTSKQRKAYFEQVNSWKANLFKTVDDHPKELNKQKKKKVALLLGFNGSGYQGMQSNPGVKSIESVLFDALCKAGCISSLNAVDPKKVQLMRAARTDKGVHASCNVVSLKMICEDPQIVEKINTYLPSDIRVWGYVETQRSFHAKNRCDSRIYEYLFPSYALTRLQDVNKNNWANEPQTVRDIKIINDHGIHYISPTDPQKLLDYRVDDESFEKFKEAMSMFKGTHNFHNYTIARSFNDRASHRHLIKINVEEPMMIEGMEWISVKLHGQSFMLHQIRKMISMGILCVRTKSPLSIISKTFESDKINIPKAPSLGLLLDRPVFQCYNDRIKNVENRKSIDFNLYKDEIEQFKRDSIYTDIFKQELEQNVFDAFLINVDSHTETNYAYFNKEGIIPQHCILTTKYSVKNHDSNSYE